MSEEIDLKNAVKEEICLELGLDKSDIVDDKPIADQIDFDSLDMVEIVVTLEEEFNITLVSDNPKHKFTTDIHQLTPSITIDQLVEMVRKALEKEGRIVE